MKATSSFGSDLGGLLMRYPLQLPISPAQYHAIGRVVATWAALEVEIKSEIAWLDLRLNSRQTVNMQSRFSVLATEWKKLANRAKLESKYLRQIDKITGKSIAIKPERDNLSHGQFGAGKLFIKYNMGLPLYISEKEATPENMRQLAFKISAIVALLLKLQLQLDRDFDGRP
jgi:hypothetical protein